MLYGEQPQMEQAQQEETGEPVDPVEQALLEGGKAQFVDKLTENEQWPEEMKERLPGFSDKEFALSFHTDSDVQQLKSMHNRAQLQVLMSMFPHEIDEELHIAMEQESALFYNKILRSRGKGRHNERKMLATQITEARYQEGEERGGGIISGTASKVKRAFGGGGSRRRR